MVSHALFYQQNHNIFHDNSKVKHNMIIKLAVHMYHGYVVILVKIVVTSLICKLDCRSKNQNVGILIVYFHVKLNIWYSLHLESSFGPQNGSLFENFEIFHIGLF